MITCLDKSLEMIKILVELMNLFVKLIRKRKNVMLLADAKSQSQFFQLLILINK